LVRSTTVREAAWTELDQAEILALAEYRSGLCRIHGGPLQECQTSEDDGGPIFEARAAVCRAQQAVVMEQKSDDAHRRDQEYGSALMWGTVKIDQPRR
jgi:hypothetical protein